MRQELLSEAPFITAEGSEILQAAFPDRRGDGFGPLFQPLTGGS